MRLLVRVVAALIVIGLLILMIGPFGSLQQSTGIWDKAAHAVAFLFIPICLAINFPFRRLSVLAGVSLAIGGIVELIQGEVGRDADWLDFAADAVGVAAAVILLILLRAWSNRPRTPLSE